MKSSDRRESLRSQNNRRTMVTKEVERKKLGTTRICLVASHDEREFSAKIQLGVASSSSWRFILGKSKSITYFPIGMVEKQSG